VRGLTFLRAHPTDAAGPAARCPPFQVVSGEALRLPPVVDLARSSAAKCREEEAIDLGTPSFRRLGVGSPRHPRTAFLRRTSWPAWPRRAPLGHRVADPCYAPSMLHTPRLSLVPLGAEHFEPLAAMYADAEIIRFLGPAPLDRGEAWRRLATRSAASSGDADSRRKPRARARVTRTTCCRRPPSSAWCIRTTSARSVWPNGAGRRSSGKWFCAGSRCEFFSGRNTDPFPLSHQRNSARVRAFAPCGRSYFSPP
jgi:hypothetical protein